ncbi:MAG: hypothetical protein NVSMB33_01580 [Ktedonobacteraceae bacterium]
MRQKHSFRTLLLVALSLAVLLLYSWSTLVLHQPVAFAHAFVIGSDPIDGSTVNSVPKVVRIFFASDISPASIAHVFAPDEHIVDAVRSTISQTNLRELDTPLIASDRLPQGGYTVRWTALATVDGHVTQGVIGFNIGHSSTGLTGQTILGPGTSNCLPQLIDSNNTNCSPPLNLLGILSVAWEWLVLMALTFWIGILITEGLILNSVERTATLLTATRKQARPLQWLCLTALLVGEVITLVLRTAQFSQMLNGGGIDIGTLNSILTTTTYGYLWFLRLALLLSALALLWWTTRQQNSVSLGRPGRPTGNHFGQMRRQIQQEQNLAKENVLEEEMTASIPVAARPYLLVWLIIAALIVFTYALSGDAASLAQPHVSAIVLAWLYLAARCVWLGGLAYLGYVLLPLLPVVEPDHHAEILTMLLRRFHPLMFGAVGVLLVSGLFLAESSISTPQQLTTDPYGRTLLVHCLLVTSMLLLSVYALFLLSPRLARQAALLPVVNAEMPARRARQSALEQTSHRLKQTFSIQSWLGAGILLCAALMAFFAPPIVFPALNYTQNSDALSSNTTQSIQTKQVGDLSITLQVFPGRVNDVNTVMIMLNDSASGNVITDANIQISLNMELMNMGTVRASARKSDAESATYTATFAKTAAFFMPGIWNIRLSIQRPHQRLVQTVFSVDIV